MNLGVAIHEDWTQQITKLKSLNGRRPPNLVMKCNNLSSVGC